MSLEEEVNQSVSRAVSLAEAAEAAAAPEEGGPQGDPDLAHMAPPAPETVANGSVAPPRGEDIRPSGPGRPGLTSRLAQHAPDADQVDGPALMGRQAPPPPPPIGAGQGPARMMGAGPQDMAPRHPLPMPSGHQVSGLGDPFGDQMGRGNGLIDPDEPTEGLRLMP
jgi:hypothetical protein